MSSFFIKITLLMPGFITESFIYFLLFLPVMTVVGFSFSKILVEKKKHITGKLEIANNVGIKDVKEIPLRVGNVKQSGLQFTFEFSSKYKPGIGSIILEGYVLYMGEKDKNEKILKNWKKNKKIPREVVTQVINVILTRCNVEAILLSREIALPPPVKLPAIEEKIKGREYIG